MKTHNHLPIKSRFKELLIDWLVIWIYLIGLFLVSVIFYTLKFGKIPYFSEGQAQLIATFASVIPIILIFTYMDYNGGTLGKKKAGLKLYFEKKSILSALIRNIIKFIPWQIGHIGTIRGMYYDFDVLSIIIQAIAIIFLLIMFYLGFFRKDNRHLGDLLANTQVQYSN